MSPAIVQLLIQAGIQYGPAFVTEAIAIIKNQNATVADVEALFAKVKPYEAYNIPNIPTAPV